MRHGFEAITIKIESTDKLALQRRLLEHPQYGRWNGPRSYADLVREAIKAFLAPKIDTPASVAAKATNGRKALAAARELAGDAFDDLPFYIHRYRGGDLDSGEGESVCGLRGLEDAHTTNIADNVTCPRCKAIRASNERAFEDAAKSGATDKRRAAKRAPKKTAKKARRR